MDIVKLVMFFYYLFFYNIEIDNKLVDDNCFVFLKLLSLYKIKVMNICIYFFLFVRLLYVDIFY